MKKSKSADSQKRQKQLWLLLFGLAASVALVYFRWRLIESRKDQDYSTMALQTLIVGRPELPTVVYLHGLLGAKSNWQQVMSLSVDQYHSIAVDLLGFGDSPKPREGYTVDNHLQMIHKTLLHKLEANKKFTLVGHSMGALLALNYAQKFPDQVEKVVLINPPLLENREDLKEAYSKDHAAAVTSLSLDKKMGHWVCRVHEMIPWIFYPLFRIFAPDLPAQVAWDASKHTWESFEYSLQEIVLKQNYWALIKQLKLPIVALQSTEDSYSTEAPYPIPTNLTLLSAPGDHNFIFKNPSAVLESLKPRE